MARSHPVARPTGRLAALALCALLHAGFVWLLLQSQDTAYLAATAVRTPPPAFVAILTDQAGAFSPRIAALVDRHLASRRRSDDLAGRRVRGALGLASAPRQVAAAQALASHDAGSAATGLAVAPATDPNLHSASAPIDWEAAKERVAREVASRFSREPADALEGGSAGQASDGLLADGAQRAGRPDCGKIYSGAAILGNGLWQYDGSGAQGCVWR